MAGFVYFVQAESGPIKVGHSVDPFARLDALQTAHFERLTLLGTIPGTIEDEKAIHRALKDHNIRGEWFDSCPALESLIEQATPHPQTPELAYPYGGMTS